MKQSKLVIVPPALQETYDQLQYAPAVRAGDFIYLSGVVATLGEEESADNITPAVNRAFDEIDMILKEAGTDWNHVVDVTSYITNIDANLLPLWAVKAERVPAPYPAWTAIGVSSLYGGKAAFAEIKITVYHPL
jgi:enamine deaminase RidA (YjgF/YER057c/UK114 family)